ncbi:MAG: DUF1343 domain-containing protein [Acidobacteria bacterium]|nr:DUF1343 domain-containing protein [Acidobacteriota bacterium]
MTGTGLETGLDRLLDDVQRLAERSYGLLSHGAAVDRHLQPAHLALARAEGGAPTRLFGPEHGFYGAEQDMVAAADQVDPWTGVPIVSLYGEAADSLIPAAEAFDGLDLLVVDLQEVGARYYTYAATAIWAAEVALGQGCEVWVLDRPNPLGGEIVEGNLLQSGYESFVGAFPLPARHGLTMGELVRLEAKRRDWSDGWHIVAMNGWRRADLWPATGRAWIAPSPNLPELGAVFLYPGLCLVEATTMSEGRGTTRPFRLVGSPGLDPVALADLLTEQQHPGVAFTPAYFRPQFQKHSGRECGGVQIEVLDPSVVAPYELGVELMAALHEVGGQAFSWRAEPYEFATDRPAIDLLTGSSDLRLALETGDDFHPWMDGWAADEERFRAEREAVLLYD